MGRSFQFVLLAQRSNRARLVQGIYQEKEKLLDISSSVVIPPGGRPDGVSLPPEGPVSVYPETSVIVSSRGLEGKEKDFYQKAHDVALQMGSEPK